MRSAGPMFHVKRRSSFLARLVLAAGANLSPSPLRGGVRGGGDTRDGHRLWHHPTRLAARRARRAALPVKGRAGPIRREKPEDVSRETSAPRAAHPGCPLGCGGGVCCRPCPVVRSLRSVRPAILLPASMFHMKHWRGWSSTSGFSGSGRRPSTWWHPARSTTSGAAILPIPHNYSRSHHPGRGPGSTWARAPASPAWSSPSCGLTACP